MAINIDSTFLDKTCLVLRVSVWMPVGTCSSVMNSEAGVGIECCCEAAVRQQGTTQQTFVRAIFPSSMIIVLDGYLNAHI